MPGSNVHWASVATPVRWICLSKFRMHQTTMSAMLAILNFSLRTEGVHLDITNKSLYLSVALERGCRVVDRKLPLTRAGISTFDL